jgi:hypothetical protein
MANRHADVAGNAPRARRSPHRKAAYASTLRTKRSGLLLSEVLLYDIRLVVYDDNNNSALHFYY